MDERMRIAVAEAFGTGFLVIGGCGTAILAGAGVGTLGISIAFGLSLLVMVYTIGPITGCHINPAVTLGLLAIGKTKKEDVPYYIVGQIVGCIVGAALIYIMAKGVDGFSSKNNFAAERIRQLLARWVQPRRGDRRRDRDDRLPDCDCCSDLPLEVLGGIRGRLDRPRAHAHPPHQHPDRQHVGEPGPQPRRRPVRRKRCAQAALGVHRLPDRRRRRRCGALPVHGGQEEPEPEPAM